MPFGLAGFSCIVDTARHVVTGQAMPRPSSFCAVFVSSNLVSLGRTIDATCTYRLHYIYMCVYTYIYIYVGIHICMCIYIYVYKRI